MPIQQTQVRMISEDVVLEQVANPAWGTAQRGADARRHWQVTAVYRFENPARRSVELQMGFPEQRCTDSCYERRAEFHGLSTTVRGQAVPQRKGWVSLGSRWSINLGRVYLYDVTFAPRETVEVVHRYTYDWSQCVSGELVHYVTQTGRLWAGTIGRARFVVRPIAKPWLIYAPPEYQLTSYSHRPASGDSARTSDTELVFEMRDWRPKEDFYLSLVQDIGCAGSIFGLDCYTYEEPPPERSLCEALVFARHGKRFEDPALVRRFYSMPAEPSEDERSCVFWPDGDPAQRLWLFPNPQYSDSMLDQDDREFLVGFAGPQPEAERSPSTPPVARTSAAVPVPPRDAPKASPPPRAAGCGHCAVADARPERGVAPLWMLAVGGACLRCRARRASSVGAAHRSNPSRPEPRADGVKQASQ